MIIKIYPKHGGFQNQPCMGYTAGCEAVSYPPLYVIHCRLWSCQLSRVSKTYLTIHTYIGDLQLENFRARAFSKNNLTIR
jgi:hypothetical protein